MGRTAASFRLVARFLGVACCCLLPGMLSCEKDDICVDGDTPLLIIRFFDSAETDTPKAVGQLRIIGLGQDAPVDTFADRSTLDSIALPLRPGETQTTFLLIENSQDEEGLEIGNIDTLRFTYGTTGAFVSRACGFVANYENLSPELQAGSGNWIQNIEVLNPSVQTQDSTHVAIYH